MYIYTYGEISADASRVVGGMGTWQHDGSDASKMFNPRRTLCMVYLK